MGNLGTAKRRIENAGRYIFRCEANNSVQGLSRSADTMLTVDGKLEQLNFCILYCKYIAVELMWSLDYSLSHENRIYGFLVKQREDIFIILFTNLLHIY